MRKWGCQVWRGLNARDALVGAGSRQLLASCQDVSDILTEPMRGEHDKIKTVDPRLLPLRWLSPRGVSICAHTDQEETREEISWIFLGLCFLNGCRENDSAMHRIGSTIDSSNQFFIYFLLRCLRPSRCQATLRETWREFNYSLEKSTSRVASYEFFET